MKHSARIICGIMLILGVNLYGAEDGSSVVVVYNALMPRSRDVAEHYAAKRGVPASQVQGFDITVSEIMTRKEYREQLQEPLLNFLESKGLFVFDNPLSSGTDAAPVRKLRQSPIRYLVLCYGVPLRIAEDPSLAEPKADQVPEHLRRNGAAVDAELSILPLSYQKVMLTGPLLNPFFGTTNSALLSPTNGFLLVARLDGPNAGIASALVDKAMEAERDGLWGRAYFDMRGLTNGAYEKGDESIAAAARIARMLGYETVVDDRPETFSAGFPMSQIALYAGWYDSQVSGPFTRPNVEFMPGAFAYHLFSFSAATLRSTTNYWCGPLLAKGAAATLGCVDEPYLEFTPNMEIFFGRWLLSGFTFGEAAYAAQSGLSWQTTVIGDPLYSPTKVSAQAHHQQLIAQGSKLVEWSHLRWVDLNLAAGGSKEEFVRYLEHEPATARSAVLTEKLGDLCAALGKTHTAITEYQRALKLRPTSQQTVRLTLELGEKLMAESKQADALKLYDGFVKSFPGYPDAVDLYRKMEAIARKLGKESDAVLYATEIRRLTMSE